MQADYHLALKPGTNVAMVTALAHVIVKEGLVNESFVRQRCDWDEFQAWADFVVARPQQPRGARSRDSACRPRTFAPPRVSMRGGGNAAIYYGLGVTEHARARRRSWASPISPWRPAISAVAASA